MTDKIAVVTELQHRLQALSQQMGDMTKQLQAMQAEFCELSTDIMTAIEFLEVET